LDETHPIIIQALKEKRNYLTIRECAVVLKYSDSGGITEACKIGFIARLSRGKYDIRSVHKRLLEVLKDTRFDSLHLVSFDGFPI